MSPRPLVLAMTVLGVLLAGAALAPGRGPRLVWNPSASAPVGLYRVTPGAPRVGEFALVAPGPALAAWLAGRGYLAPGTPLLKRVAAGPGQAVCRRGVLIRIDGRLAGRALTRDRRGRRLPAWTGCRRLGPSEIFLLNPPADSLDGRYFGPTPRAQVVGRARPLFVAERL